jgi:carbamoyl-phosphate synthase large subunit
MSGKSFVVLDFTDEIIPSYYSVKEAVFPFSRFPNVDVVLGPEMKSTGEAMGIDVDFAHAFAKAHLASGALIPTSGCAFISVKDSDKFATINIARDLIKLGFKLIATRGTQSFLSEQGIEVSVVNKVLEGRPHIVDLLKDNKVSFVVNTTEGTQSLKDSFSIRRTSLQQKVTYCTTIAGTRALVSAMHVIKNEGGLNVKSLQSYAA